MFVKGEQFMYNRFEQLLQKNNVTAYRVAKETGIAQTTFSDWKKGKSSPKIEKLSKIADYFGVSIEYFTKTDSEPFDKVSPKESLYISTNISDKIKQLCKSKGIFVKKMLEDIGLGFNTMSNMKTSMPKADNLAKIADYLDCSVDYLLGRTTDPESHKHEKKQPTTGNKSKMYSL